MTDIISSLRATYSAHPIVMQAVAEIESLRAALVITRCTIRGELIEGAVINSETMMPLGRMLDHVLKGGAVRSSAVSDDAAYRKAIDDALVTRHIGVAQGNARDELHAILSWEVGVALDPRVSEAAQSLIDQGRTAPQTAPQSVTSDYIDKLFAGYGVAIRKLDDKPIPGEPFMSIREAKKLALEIANSCVGPQSAHDDLIALNGDLADQLAGMQDAAETLLAQYDLGAGHCLGVMSDGNACFKGSFLEKLEALKTALAHCQAVSARPSFQARVAYWMAQCFPMKVRRDRQERNHRFLEEALELVQACGCTASEAHQLVDYVYGRDQGDINQEVGGVMVTLAALCLANQIDMHEGGEVELARIMQPETMNKIRAKQAAKPKHSPLPEDSKR